MKHSLPVTVALISLFVLAQVLGVWLLARSMTVSVEDGITATSYDDTLLGARPEASPGTAVIMLLAGILLGTVLLLVLIRFRKQKVWKAWFFLAVWVTVSVSIKALLPMLGWVAWIVGAGLAFWKILKPNVIIHNVTEVLTYAGIGLIFAPLLGGSLLMGLVLLGAISIYDMYAVWKSKHMVKMAEFQASSNVFAGLFVPYGGKMPKNVKASNSVQNSSKEPSAQKSGPRHAILGGGDLAFPLLFTGVVLDFLVRRGMDVWPAFFQSMWIVAGSTLALALLFFMARKDKYYPAMPFLSAGCVLGLFVALYA
jgi:presenilin-like A22 family membrane protease